MALVVVAVVEVAVVVEPVVVVAAVVRTVVAYKVAQHTTVVAHNLLRQVISIQSSLHQSMLCLIPIEVLVLLLSG